MLGAKILALCWNSNGIKICETLSSTVEEERRKGYKKYVTQECDHADFVPKLKSLIEELHPDIVCIGFEQDPNTGTYFHSKLLPHVMESDLPYKQIYRDTMTGGGVSTSGFTSGALRMSIYGKGGWGKSTLKKTYECGSLKDGTGGMSCVLDLNGKLLAVINAYVAFDKESVKQSRMAVGNYPKDDNTIGDPMVRQDALNYANICYNGIIRHLVLNLKVKPDYVILMGDLNYRNDLMDFVAETAAAMFYKLTADTLPGFAKDYYEKFDELHQQMKKGNIYQYDEGKDNSGPSFAPVCVMKKGRECETDYRDCWDTKVEYILPSWCNRILYKNYDNSDKMCCTKYDRFESGKTMRKSKNTAVYALFQIGKCEDTARAARAAGPAAPPPPMPPRPT
uniref:Inositol polyphosphate-related phosphatase domain-containing protein n=1 Tax=Marseillevirus LCMAC101 TaxID=2506602 RepID=A0A481YR40_9VIRU|nr:MAG: uncharacterized protein LCMAC101_03280 [Marseillevirus LCMAC101]